jgi:hypothetical protein
VAARLPDAGLDAAVKERARPPLDVAKVFVDVAEDVVRRDVFCAFSEFLALLEVGDKIVDVTIEVV